MEAMIALGAFFTVTLVVYGLFYRGVADGDLDARLGGLRYSSPTREALPDPDAAFSARVVNPIIKNFMRRVNNLLPSTISERLEKSITRAGLRVSAGQFIVVVGVLAGVVPLLFAVLMASKGASPTKVILLYAMFVAIGLYGPRVWLSSRIKKRQKLIWRSLPDAFDLITASVEAGLGIDAAFSRVLHKVTGPFAEELGRTMREISMGRQRRDALMDMADRTGVDEFRSLVNAIVQAESMGISIGTVIRIQTGVIRTKRKQRAEEQAFKAPIKMVFPLVFFIFPTIMIVIGGAPIVKVINGGLF